MDRTPSLNDRIHYPDPASRLMIQPHKTPDFSGSKDPTQLFHEDIEIKYSVSGKLHTLVNDVLYTLTAGDILVVNPFEFHANVPINGQKCVYHLIEVHPDYFPAHGSGRLDLRAATENKQCFDTVIRQDTALGGLIGLLAAEHSERGANYMTAGDLLLEVLFYKLLRNHTRTADTSGENVRPDAYANCFRNVVENHTQLLAKGSDGGTGGRWYGSENQ